MKTITTRLLKTPLSPVLGKNEKIIVSCQVDKELGAKIEKAAKLARHTKSDFLRAFIDNFLAKGVGNPKF